MHTLALSPLSSTKIHFIVSLRRLLLLVLSGGGGDGGGEDNIGSQPCIPPIIIQSKSGRKVSAKKNPSSLVSPMELERRSALLSPPTPSVPPLSRVAPWAKN